MADQDIFINDGLSSGASRSGPSGWTIFLIILLLGAIAAAVTFGILWGNCNNAETSAQNALNRKLILEGARITANGNSITGAWERVDDPTDVVALFVSEKPFQYKDDGTILVTTDVSTTSKSALEVSSAGNNANSITVSERIQNNRSYNAAMVVSNPNTVSTITFGPVKVFTQTTENLSTGKLFNIRDLNNCTGLVSSIGGYTTTTGNSGIYRLGSGDDSPKTNMDRGSSELLVRYNDNNPTSMTQNPTQVLCRRSTMSTDVILGSWINENIMSATPIICQPGMVLPDNTACTDMAATIPLANCNWIYNSADQGENKWCLSQPQSLNALCNETTIACLTRNGGSKTLSVGESKSAGRWFNEFTGDTPANNFTVA